MYHGVTGFSPYPSPLDCVSVLVAKCKLPLRLVKFPHSCCCPAGRQLQLHMCLGWVYFAQMLTQFLISSSGSKASKVSNHALSWVCLDWTSNVFWSCWIMQCPRWKVGLASTSSARPGTHWVRVLAFFRWPTSHLTTWPFEVPWAKLASLFAPSDGGGLGLAAAIDQSYPIIIVIVY